MRNIVLIGMPGVGKSTLGVLLARQIGFHFLDTDLVIQAREGKLLRELIAEHGDDGFLQLEEEICAALEADRSVIATGGSLIYEPRAMAHLHELGTVVYLKLGYKPLARRLGDLKKRGVVLRPGQTLRMLYDERVPLYERYADVTVECNGQNTENCVRLLRKKLHV